MLAGKRLLKPNIGSLVAGTRLRSQREERLRRIIEEVKNSGNCVLLFDELHTLVGAGAEEGSNFAANILKSSLARGELQTICATTLDEFRKYIERDAALERRFQSAVEEPSIEDTIEILQETKESYEQHHRVEIYEEAIKTAVELGMRYVPDRSMPDKAMDLIDEAASRVDLQGPTASEPRGNDALWPVVTSRDVVEVVAMWTSVPVARIATDAQGADRLLGMEDVLSERVKGQEDAIVSVARAVWRAQAELSNTKRPRAVLAFLGPLALATTKRPQSSGVGAFH
jgi:ATP-dependent Clp protease ATP-binding subunit ClpC